MRRAVLLDRRETESVSRHEDDALERHADEALSHAIEVSELEAAAEPELRIPPDTREKFMYRDHGV